MSLLEVLDDLLTLEELAQHEGDPDRRRALDLISPARERLGGMDAYFTKPVSARKVQPALEQVLGKQD
ncbi:MAG TPA: hypothetical protein VF711_14135 [Acidimicrobiales bacterium]